MKKCVLKSDLRRKLKPFLTQLSLRIDTGLSGTQIFNFNMVIIF